jgi:uncharacterized protein (TIGR02099 family)
MPLISPLADAAPSQRAPSDWPARRPLRWAVRIVLGLVLVAGSLLLIAWLILHWGILPRIEQWRPQIEARASSALGVPVRIGAIEVRSGGWVPAIELRDVRLLDATQRPALQLPRVAAAVSARSLLSFELRLSQLLVDGARLEMRRDAQGRVFVAGFDVGAPGADAGNAALRNWFFQQHEVVVRNGALRWTDEQRGAAPLALEAVDLVVRNGLLQHELRLDGTPDAAWGERFSLRGRFVQPLLAEAGDWRRWSGDAYVDLPRVDVSALRRYVDLPFELSAGVGGVRAWLGLAKGEARSATIDVALRTVELRLARQVEAMNFAQIEGRFVASRSDEGVALAAQRFGFVTGDGVRWPHGDLRFAWRQRGDGPVTGGDFSAQRLDLALMAQIAARIPFAEAHAQMLAELHPQGIVNDLSASWQGPFEAPTRYQVRAGLQGLTLAARPSTEPHGVGRPGVHNASLQVSANEGGGTARLGLDGGALEFPGVLAEPVVDFDAFASTIAWKFEPVAGAAPKISVQVKDTTFANDDAEGSLDASWQTGPASGDGPGQRLPGRIEMNGRITRGAADKVARYLPLWLSDTRSYLEHAARGGTISAATYRVRGELRDFPYAHAKSPADGEFRFAGKVDDLGLAYVPDAPASGASPAYVSPWPAFSRVGGEIVIDRGSLEIRSARAQWGGVVLSGVQGRIRSLGEGAVLAIEGGARGPLAEMLRFVDASPVGQWTGKALAAATTTGPAELKLALTIPLGETQHTAVKGSVVLPGNDLRLLPETPLLANARGRVDFTQQGFTVAGATARVLGGETSLDGGTQPDGTVRLNGQGSVTAEGLRRAVELGPLARAAGAMNGQASYRLALGFVRGHPEFNLTSNLVGLGLDLPAPLKKAADTPLVLRVQSQLVPESLQADQSARDTLRLELGQIVQAHYSRDLGPGAARVRRGGIGVFEPAPTPPEGVAANINLALLNVDEWEAAGERLFGSAGAAAAARPRDDGARFAGASAYVPDHVALRAQTLRTGGRQFDRIVAGLSHDDGTWRANLDAEQLNGYVEYRAPRSARGAGRLHARLARLSLPKSDADQVEALLDQQEPATVPALDIVIDDFELRGKRLGRLEIDAVNRSAGGVREWRLNRFSLAVPEAQLSGSGNWSEVGGTFLTLPGAAATVRRRAVINFKLEMGNAGTLLERLGTAQAIRGGKGTLAGQLSWLGSPLALDYPSLTGDVAVNVDAGQFLKVDPGAARLLGVLNLQALPRRLALDFRDVFNEGFAFDNVAGDVKIALGVAQTNNLRMRGVQAVVLMEGRADIARETQDLRVVVVPEINAGTAALAYAVINPAIGLGTFLAQALLRKPLAQAGTREFHVTGSWADPKVERIERKFDNAPTDGEAGTTQLR